MVRGADINFYACKFAPEYWGSILCLGILSRLYSRSCLSSRRYSLRSGILEFRITVNGEAVSIWTARTALGLRVPFVRAVFSICRWTAVILEASSCLLVSWVLAGMWKLLFSRLKLKVLPIWFCWLLTAATLAVLFIRCKPELLML